MENKEILDRLYDTIKERPTTTNYNNLRKEYAEKKDKFLEKVGEQNEEELEDITNILHEMNNILSKQDFCEGFSIAVRLFVEATYKDEGDA